MSNHLLSSAIVQRKAGDRLGPYEIVALLGAGGMGEVYRAHDSRLDRTVAIKVLPAHLSSRPELRQRFEREARAISSLSHPNICAVFDTGEAGGNAYLVMEYLEGDTLADKLVRGPLPLQQVVRSGVEICQALDAAHRHGITHRDLKPGNIMLTKSGVKLLDFGLAKLSQTVTATTSDALTASVQPPLTGEGTFLGTLQYMAPEQLEGREADARTDIFALGAVLYEMTTGRRAFEGSTRTSIMTAIMHSDPPPLATLQPLSPPALERIIRPCLAKDPEERWQTARDVGLQLKGVSESGSHTGAVVPPRTRRRAWLVPAIGGALAGALLASIPLTLLRTKVSPAERSHLSLLLPNDQTLTIENNDAVIAISADGSKVVYNAVSRSGRQLFLRTLSEGGATPLAGTENANSPFFNPTGTAIGFIQRERLKTISLTDGAMTDLGPSGGPGRGGTWLRNGTIVFVGLPAGPMQRLVPGGKIEPIDAVAAGEGGHFWPHALPDDRTILYTAELEGKSFDEARIMALDLETKKSKVILEGGTYPRFVPPDRLFFVRHGRLYTTGFDPKNLVVVGKASEVLQPVLDSPGSGAAYYDVANDGKIIAVPYNNSIFNSRLVLVDRAGKIEPLPLQPRRYVGPRVSPNGKKLLVGIEGANDDLWISDVSRGTFTRLTFRDENLLPVWSADGGSIFFARYRQNMPQLMVLRADGSGEPQKILDSPAGAFAAAVSADGKSVAFVQAGGGNGFDVGVLSLEGTRKVRRMIASPFNENAPDFSPDGQWLVYASDESGRSEIYAQRIDGGGEKTQISTDGGSEPIWSHRGGEIFYRSGDRVMAVAVSTTGNLSASNPRLLFEREFAPPKLTRNYDLLPDDSRFLFVERLTNQASQLRRIDVIVGGAGTQAPKDSERRDNR